MKTFGCVMAIVLVCLAGATQADVMTGSLLTNGDFTSGSISPWQGAGVAAATSSPDGHDMEILGANEAYYDMTSVTLSPGQQYDISYMAASPNASATGPLTVRVWGNDGHTSFPVADEQATVALLNSGWATYTYTWTVPASGLASGGFPEITFDGAGATTAIYAVDKVAFGLHGTLGVPEPGTLVLVATGLFGLLAYAWRKQK
jgi:hypothetical protein